MNTGKTRRKKYFLVQVTTKYDGYEWGCYDLLVADDEGQARERAEQRDYTHRNGSEEQEIASVKEIPYGHYCILKRYMR